MTSSRIHTTLPGISLRQAERPDAALVLDFIHKLAAYEKLSHEVQATVGDIEDALFGARPFAEAAIAELDAAPVGFILWFPNYSTFVGKPGIHIEDLFVLPHARGRGIGRCLLAWAARVAQEPRPKRNGCCSASPGRRWCGWPGNFPRATEGIMLWAIRGPRPPAATHQATREHSCRTSRRCARA
jgi:GNAT superfamily N-acetyltransferase